MLVGDDGKPLNLCKLTLSSNETASFIAYTSSKVNKASKSGSEIRNKSLYEQWKETYDENPYDYDDCVIHGLTNAQMKFVDAYDISLRGQLR